MGDASQLQTSPYALFDPSQWSNPYSRFQNQALPAASYAGWPTDAMGNPIGAPPGMTLNQTPAQPQAAPPAAAAPPPQLRQISPGGMLPSGQNYGSDHPTYIPAQYGYAPAPQQAGAGAAPQQAAAPANNAGLTPQQYMQLRANPGPVPTFGANVPQASQSPPGAGVLQNFLANWKPAQSGAGSGFQQGFAAALKNQGY
jgi:hypothetical protein